MGEQDAAGPDAGRQVADGRAVQVLGTGHDRAGPERDLAQQRVAGAGQDVEVLGTSAVARVDEAGTYRWFSRSRAASETRNPKLDEVWVTRAAWISKAATRSGALAEGFDVQGRGAEPGLVVEGVEAVVETGRPDHPDPPARLLPAQVVAERHEIDEVVRVEMADDHRVERRRIEVAASLANDP